MKNKKINVVTTDPIADMLTRMRNAINVKREEVLVPVSKIKMEIAKILVKEGYLVGAVEEDRMIKLTFKMTNDRQRVIQGLRRISKPGLRVYSESKDLPRVLSGLGIAIVSTSSGLMTDKEAREKNLGGEVLAYIW